MKGDIHPTIEYMTHSLSVLMPAYNNVCVELVRTLQSQAAALPWLEYEILVADDGSTDSLAVAENRGINALPHCRYVERGRNTGRAAIRNFLAREARYDRLLFLDSDLRVDDGSFVEHYALAGGDVVVGGLKISGDPKKLARNLRYRYEKACEKDHDCRHRRRSGYREFRTTSFLVSRQAVRDCPFDESFKGYGYEDVLFGKSLADKGYRISHIDNPVVLDDYEDNGRFVLKTEEACRTLRRFKEELRGYSKLIACEEGLERWHLRPVARITYRLFGVLIRRRLVGGRPNAFLYNLYKLLYYMCYDE